MKDFAENTPSKRRYNLRMVRNSFPGAPNKTVHRVRIVENDLFPKTLGKTALFSLLDVEKKLCGKPVSICSPHQIHNVQVEEILLRQLKSITAYARSHETEFVELVTKQNEKELNRLMRSSSKELVQAKERIKKLDSIMQRLYEDNLDGKISDDRFFRMSATYETEQKQLEARVSELEAAIAEAREQRLNVDSFLGMVRRYTDITELTAEIIRSFVEKIEVKKPEKVPGTRTKKQTLVIWCNFIGVVDIPQQEQKETA